MNDCPKVYKFIRGPEIKFNHVFKLLEILLFLMDISHLSMVNSSLSLKSSSTHPLPTPLCFLGHLIYECFIYNRISFQKW